MKYFSKSKENNEVVNIMQKIDADINIAVKKIVKLIKENSKTYGELISKIEKLKNSVIWDIRVTERYINVTILNRCIELVKKEINELEIDNKNLEYEKLERKLLGRE
ncbi:MAG: hypothetical protein KH415_23630 [Clostridium sp.]|nr:hypothetical protein [Clostridium sp.]